MVGAVPAAAPVLSFPAARPPLEPPSAFTPDRRDSLASVRTVGVWEDICAICLSPPSDPFTTGCGHTFCRDCLVQVRQPRCPECRSPLVIGNIGAKHDGSGLSRSPRHQSPTRRLLTRSLRPRGLQDLLIDVSQRMVGLLFSPRPQPEERQSRDASSRVMSANDAPRRRVSIRTQTHRADVQTPPPPQAPQAPRPSRSQRPPSTLPLLRSTWPPADTRPNTTASSSRSRRVVSGRRPVSGWLRRYQAVDNARLCPF